MTTTQQAAARAMLEALRGARFALDSWRRYHRASKKTARLVSEEIDKVDAAIAAAKAAGIGADQ